VGFGIDDPLEGVGFVAMFDGVVLRYSPNGAPNPFPLRSEWRDAGSVTI